MLIHEASKLTAGAAYVTDSWLPCCSGRLFGLLAQGQTQAEEQAARHSDNSEAPSATAGAPEEPALQSEVGQQQAAAVEGRAARQPESDETPAAQEGALLPGMAQYAPSIQHGMLDSSASVVVSLPAVGNQC